MKTILVILLIVCAAASFAADFRINNETGVSIWYIYISKSTDEYWGDDWLGESEMLSNGSSKTYNLNTYDTWDIMLIDENENTYSLSTTVHPSGFTWTVTPQSMD